ncbi:MAG: NAD+ synthase [Microcystis aeruginosa Ma_MB_F_20061100_S19]|uniref:Glutamine-dependent NAD(+) synthetase n=1 Tax=Microcystis aeruginosa SPC777 TaxID=482300 RepID=S3J4W7_MICAE|nr:NAD+ synthase [Microcystis aeruginosa]NCR98127.1 NAD+ synthase [Microcystis aeruginosa L311-01]OCY11922.1 MAG: NAD+ synthase [Microcystis aeruginosa CACIAM 03]TRU04762.1 MAG: NAD+ synthase [Microcystis aeruginosa Ma_MB_F_20061100_S19D]TRU13797.1 MAG: NAD+ synthase [Microcystis aeruginosa Ma_MB_F_20061100_S19]EPF20938.1 Glutamine-dependent NAD(+) synthetase [Microcystis aeruginosa SPC777]
MRIAIAQLNPIVGDIEGNAQRILEAAQTAFNQGAELLLTPELSLCGYPPRDLLLNLGFVEKMSRQLQLLSQQLPEKLAVLVGFVEKNPSATVRGEKPLFNSIALLKSQEIKQIFTKRLLPTYDVFDEDRYFASGKESQYFQLTENNVKIGVTICEDVWNDEQFWGQRQYAVNPIADLASLGVDLIVNLSASPYSVGKQKLRESLLSHSATRYNLPIVYVNQVGGNDDLIFDGDSVAFNRQGEVIYRAQAFTSSLELIEFNQDLLPAVIHPLPVNEDEEIYRALVLGVRDYVQKCGFKRVIFGLSGGIDSSLVAAIASDALGKENVLAVMMPSPYSSDHSISDAVALVNNLGIKSEKLAIKEIMTAYDQLLERLFAGTDFGIAEENLQSRIRGNLLMALSNKFGHLLLSTGNKSEMAVGYCTLYGDMNGGLAVIADVPKTRVYSLCRWLNRHGEIIPLNVINKAPSAELKPNQKDQDSLPPYEILDAILALLIDRHQSAEQIIAAGFEAEIVQKVIKLVKNAEFKRKQAPPGLKISDRAFGTGWRMPIASRWD